MDRKSFVLYTTSKEIINMLNDEQSGILFKGILEYVTDGNVPEMDGMTKIVFTTIRNYLDKDFENYEAKCEANRLNGHKGGRPKKNRTVIEENPTKPNGFCETEKPIEGDPDSVPEEKKEKANVKKRSSHRFERPTVEEIRQYAKSKGYQVDVQRFFDYYEANEWHDKDGKPVKSWKQKLITWSGRNNQGTPTKKGTGVTMNDEQRKDYADFNEFFGE